MAGTVRTFLMFHGRCEAAMFFYVSSFKNAAITSIQRFQSRTSGPSLPFTGSVSGTATSGIVFKALAWFSGVGRVICIAGPGG